ncbi:MULTISPECIES: hypothetical protein [unclassified Providencia]|uniref:hypothetical protein n=1 Tax=unclassified Providencia TaxID=2633465 RepID=UPI00234B6123|nr:MULTISPECIES: hypothetical protein [unclassified Providencia]
MADRWGEPDPRKIAQLPANIITHWQAFFMPEQENTTENQQTTASIASVRTDIESQCHDVMRAING